MFETSILGIIPNESIHFFQIDILLLPTRYVNEVEPLVILESLRNGVPVLANSRGCIDCLLPSTLSLVSKSPSTFNLWLSNSLMHSVLTLNSVAL